MRRFARFACIDWSGQAVARPRGIAIACCDQGDPAPALCEPDGGWSREAVLGRLLGLADTAADILVGIDLSTALPFADRGAYFPGWPHSPANARDLWALVDRLCAGEPHLAATRFVDHLEASRHFRRHGGRTGDLFGGGIGRLRVAERACRDAGLGGAQSCFNLIGAAQVGKSSLTGMRVLHRLSGRVPVWPFDPVPASGPLIVEVYTTIAARRAGLRGRSKIRDPATLDEALAVLGSRPQQALARTDDHATDAMITAAWLRGASADAALWSPPAMTAVRETEGWTFGVP